MQRSDVFLAVNVCGEVEASLPENRVGSRIFSLAQFDKVKLHDYQAIGRLSKILSGKSSRFSLKITMIET